MKNRANFGWSEIPYGVSELKKEAALRYSTARTDSLLRGEFLQCCIRDCEEQLPKRHRGQTPLFCPNHGISVSTKPTYIYADAERNFIIGKQIPTRLPKVENFRLGHETSEDAVSWNVFVSIYALDGLAEAFEKLTGIAATEEPELYLWGNRIDSQCRKWERLREVRNVLEQELTFPTEPDIMLRVPGQAIVLIEAKFGSSNPRLADKKNRFGSVAKFLNRYKCKDGRADPLDRNWISEQEDDQILEQLCRNAVFAHWLASGVEQPFVINLIPRKATSDEQLFRHHLTDNDVQFHVRRWEDLCGLSVLQGAEPSVVMSYLKDKTMNFSRAFDLP
jgi:hypothetical protein